MLLMGKTSLRGEELSKNRFTTRRCVAADRQGSAWPRVGSARGDLGVGRIRQAGRTPYGL